MQNREGQDRITVMKMRISQRKINGHCGDIVHNIFQKIGDRGRCVRQERSGIRKKIVPRSERDMIRESAGLLYRKIGLHMHLTPTLLPHTIKVKGISRDNNNAERIKDGLQRATTYHNQRDSNAKVKKKLHGNTQRRQVTAVFHMLRIIVCYIMPWHAWFQFPGRRTKTNFDSLQEWTRG